MGLYERWTAGDETKLSVHAFCTALREHSRDAVTRTQIINAFDLSGDDIIEFDAIRSYYAGLSTQAEKDAYVVILHDVGILAESKFYDRAKCADRLGFS